MNINILFQFSLDQKFKEVKNALDKLQLNPSQILETIQSMDEIQHSLIFLYFGDVMILRGVNPTLLQKFENFLLNYSREQILLNTKKLFSISQKYIDVMIANKCGIKAIKIIQIAVLRLANGKPEFTEMHTQYALLCLKTKMYKASLSIIDLPILSFTKGLGAQEMLIFNYFYYRGVLYIGLKKYQQAIESFSYCINLQMQILYQPIIEARKKLILLLMLKNKNIARIINQENQRLKPLLQKIIDIKTSVYLKLLQKDAFENQQNFNTYLESNLKKLKKDKNLGLAKQVKYSIFLNALKKLRKIYTMTTNQFNFNNFSIITNRQLFEELNLPAKTDITNIVFYVNDIKHIVKINRQLNSIEFVGQNEIEYDKLVNDFSEEYIQLKGIIEQFQDAYEEIVQERLMTPDTMYA